MSGLDLVTGGAGFIGSHLVTALVASGRRVRVVDDLSTGDRARLSDVARDIEFFELDLATADLTASVRGVERVFHLAALGSVPRSVDDPELAHRAVATATLRILVAARDAKVGRFVHSSSSSVYGDSAVSPKHEGLPLRPVSPYGVAKVAAESYVRIFASLFQMETVSLRYFNVFGPAQDADSAYAAVIPLFISKAMRGETLVVNGDGTQTRDFTYVDDVVDANVKAAVATGVAGHVYNIAAGDPRSLNDLCDALGRIVGRPLRVEHGPWRAGDIVHSAADSSAARRELGWQPTVDFEEGLRRTVALFAR